MSVVWELFLCFVNYYRFDCWMRLVRKCRKHVFKLIKNYRKLATKIVVPKCKIMNYLWLIRFECIILLFNSIKKIICKIIYFKYNYQEYLLMRYAIKLIPTHFIRINQILIYKDIFPQNWYWYTTKISTNRQHSVQFDNGVLFYSFFLYRLSMKKMTKNTTFYFTRIDCEFWFCTSDM